MKLQLTSLKEYVFVNSAFKIQCYIVKKNSYRLFLAISPTENELLTSPPVDNGIHLIIGFVIWCANRVHKTPRVLITGDQVVIVLVREIFKVTTSVSRNSLV